MSLNRSLPDYVKGVFWLLFFQKGQGELIFRAVPFFIAAVAFCFFFTSFFADIGSNVLLLLFTVTETGPAVDYGLFFK